MNPTNHPPLTRRDRITAAALILLVAVVQQFYMGPAVAMITAGLVASYFLWAFTNWHANPSKILPLYYLAVALQFLHFIEEYFSGFQRKFPQLLGYHWTDARFLIFNLIWIAIFILAALVIRRSAVAHVIVIFLAAGGVAHGAGHILLFALSRGAFPGIYTAPFLLIIGILLLLRLYKTSAEPV
jgi:hypothetical protein